MALFNFTIYGDAPALKNNKIIVNNGPHPRLISNPRVVNWTKNAIKQMNDLGLSNEYIDIPLRVRYDVYKQTNRKWDTDNIAATVNDMLTKSKFYLDDSQIIELIVRKHKPDKDNPRIEISVDSLEWEYKNE